MNPFEYAHDLVTKESYDEEIPERKDYKQFLINRTLSYHNDIIHYVNELNSLGFKAYNTQANFIFVIIPEKKNQSASLINEYLISKGIAVRYLLSYGLKNALRITLGTKEELNKTIETLKEFIKKND